MVRLLLVMESSLRRATAVHSQAWYTSTAGRTPSRIAYTTSSTMKKSPPPCPECICASVALR